MIRTVFLVITVLHRCATPAADFVPFRTAGQGLDVYIGAAGPVSLLYDKANASYQAALARNYNLTTAENACKWAATEPQQGTFALEGCSGVSDFASKSGMVFRGHNLCWGNDNPSWLFSLNASEKQQALQNHVTKLVGHFGESVIAWDVVNEAVADSLFSDVDRALASRTAGDSKLREMSRKRPDSFLERGYEGENPWGFKKSVWYPDVPEYVWTAFSAARVAAPASVKLFYNDYAIADASSDKAKRVYALAKNLTAAGLLDGIGFQMHVDVGWEKDHIDGFVQSLKQYKRLGLEVHVTEMDVNNTQARNDTAQALTYSSVLSACLNSSACKNFETWGFTDAHTWKGTGSHPLPFNTTLLPKAAAWAISGILASAPREEEGGPAEAFS